MGLLSGLKNAKNKGVKVGKSLFGYNQIVGGTRENYSTYKDIFKANFSKKVEPGSDEELYLPKESVESAKKGFKKLVVVFLILFAFSLIYSISSFLTQNWALGFVILAFSLVCLALVFRYHFWLYQIQTQTLGVSFQEYYQNSLKKLFNKKNIPRKDKK